MISITVNGENIFFADANVTKSIMTAAGIFSFKIGAENLQYKYGDKVQVFSSDKMIINGKIEHIRAIKNKEVDEIIYSGRDNTGDFIDSYFDNAIEFNRSLNLEKIISNIAAKFNVEVVSQVSVKNFSQGELPTAYAGQNIFDFCDKLCRIRSVLLTVTNDGKLLITDEGAETNQISIIFGSEYGNSFERSFESDSTKEFDRYVVFSQNNSTLDSLNNLVNVRAQAGNGIRVKTLIENNSLDVGECLTRAKFEQEMDFRRSTRYIAKIADDMGYFPNQKVSVLDETLSIDEQMLIISVKWVYNKNADHVEVTLERIP